MICLGHPQKGFFSFLYPMVSLPPSEGILMHFHHPVNTISNECLYHPHKGFIPYEGGRDALMRWLPFRGW